MAYTFNSNIGLPKGYFVDPMTGELVRNPQPSATLGPEEPTASQSVPTFAPTTNYETLSQRPGWETGTPQRVPITQEQSNGQTHVDQYGDVWMLVGDQWIKQQTTEHGVKTFANGPAGELAKRSMSGTTADMLDYLGRSNVGRRDVMLPGQPGFGTTAAGQAAMGGQGGQPQFGMNPNQSLGRYQDLLNDTSGSRNFDNQNAWWQGAIEGGIKQADTDYGAMVDRQKGFDNDAINRLNDLYGQQQANAGKYNQQANDLFGAYSSAQMGLNAQDQANLSRYMSETDPYMRQLSGISFDPEGLAAQRQGLSMAQGAAGGALDYSAAQAQLTQAQLTRAQLERYQSNSRDVDAQWDSYNKLAGVGGGSLNYSAKQWSTPAELVRQQRDALNRITEDIDSGGAAQERVLAEIQEDLARGGDGQRDAIARIKQELDGGAGTMSAQQQEALSKLLNEVENGGADLKDAIGQYRELTKPKATAQERYLADIARRSFEAQDRGNREAQMEDMAFRGIRSGGAEIAAMDSQRQQLGQDRTQAELGLQANAIGRSMQALEGYTNASGLYRAQQLQGHGMYADATAQARAQQQEALALYSDAENQLRAAQQQGLALSAQQTNAIRAAQQNAIAMYNESAARMREQADSVGMFNTNQYNTAQANNQATRLSGMQSAAAQSNAIRGANDQVGMFNTGQANNMSMFNAGQANSMSMFNAGQANQTSQFNAGQQNQAYANNQATRMQGINSSIGAANSLRSANDAVNMFNATYAQNEASRISGLAGQRAQTGLATTGQIGGRNNDIFGAGTGTINTNYLRDMDTTQMGIGMTGTTHGIRTGTNALEGQRGQTNFGNIMSGFGGFITGSGMSTGIQEAERERQARAAALGVLSGRMS